MRNYWEREKNRLAAYVLDEENGTVLTQETATEIIGHKIPWPYLIYMTNELLVGSNGLAKKAVVSEGRKFVIRTLSPDNINHLAVPAVRKTKLVQRWTELHSTSHRGKEIPLREFREKIDTTIELHRGVLQCLYDLKNSIPVDETGKKLEALEKIIQELKNE